MIQQQYSRRGFLRSASLGTAALTLGLPKELLALGEPSRAPRLHPGGEILLNSNENAYGPMPSVAPAMAKALEFANRYPDRQIDNLTERIAAYHSVSADRVMLGCGSTEILRMAVYGFLQKPGAKLVTASPTFEVVEAFARIMGAPVATVPLTSDYGHDLDAMRAAVGSAGLVYICNPNNPTASLTPRRQIEDFITALPPDVTVLIDEAYHHFAVGAEGYTSFLEKPVHDPRVVVARTFSKIYGMAGIRLGYAVAEPEAINAIARYQLPDHINMVATLSGATALDDDTGMKAAIARNARDRDDFMHQAAARGVKPIPSYCNFLMMPAGRPAEEVIAHFKRNGILIGRRFPALENSVRVSLGTPAQMQAFWRVWDTLPATHAGTSGPATHAGTSGS